MPEYLAPGVYVEETSFRAKSIEGVGTSTTAFVGPTRKGPVSGGENAPERPELLTSFGDFERIYGGLADLEFDGLDDPVTNYMAHAALAYFNEGGSRLYVSRVFAPPADEGEEEAGGAAAAASVIVPEVAGEGEGEGDDGDEDGPSSVRFEARFPGTAGNGEITVIETVAPASAQTMNAAPPGTLLLRTVTAAEAEDGEEEEEAEPVLEYYLKDGDNWRRADDADGEAVSAEALTETPDEDGAQIDVDVDIITLLVVARDADENELSWEDLGFDESHPRGVMHVLAAEPARRADHLQNPFAIVVGKSVDALELRERLFDEDARRNAQRQRQRDWPLVGGTDGREPKEHDYRDALNEVAALEDVAIVAAPGSSAYGDGNDARAIMNALILHAGQRRAYRIAVLDTPEGQTPRDVRQLRGQLDSRYAAMYYPWVMVSNPNARPGREDIRREIALPPSGYVCGIYARNDVQNGVHKAPANEVVRSALRFEFDINFRQQELLNPLGVNCLRLLSGRGYRVWGARLISSDPEWKYVSDRRYFNYLEASIDRGTQWAVFEPNGERLWANVRQTISDFLYNEWRNGALLGATPEEAFFVRCDRSTMTQNDLDNGRLICLIGVAIIKPAEFVIFRIGQKTADRRA